MNTIKHCSRTSLSILFPGDIGSYLLDSCLSSSHPLIEIKVTEENRNQVKIGISYHTLHARSSTSPLLRECHCVRWGMSP